MYAVILIFMVAQILGATFFAGTRRGIQVPLNGFSYVAWGYRGLVNNEFVDSDHTFTCTVRPTTCPSFCWHGMLWKLSIHPSQWLALSIEAPCSAGQVLTLCHPRGS